MTKAQTEKLLDAIRDEIRRALQPPSRSTDWYTGKLRKIDAMCEEVQKK